ncbi:MAG: DNA-binding NtrC family response regulator [Arenicella sp.]|jgi:DNA-binding NtrC family response regulator
MALILIIDDDLAVRTSLKLLLESEGFDAYAEGEPEEALRWLTRRTPQAIFLDMNFTVETSGDEGLAMLAEIKKIHPNIPIILITGWGSIGLAVEGMKTGASDFLNKPWENEHLLQSLQTALKLEKSNQVAQNRGEIDEQFDFGNIVGKDPKLLQVLQTIGRVAKTEASVLILGENGTGKELIAEAVHENSLRNHKGFVKVNLGGVSSTLFESEMFGHKKGAFTDAKTDRVGRFEMAEKGSIFLDEIGDLDHSSQVKLLRVLQDRTYEILGSSQPQKADVRVIAATNKDLVEMISENKFREDLFYRINLITVYLPSLRERADDIPLLANHFVNNLREIYQRPNLEISKKALNWLRELPLPGNIRQLKNLVERTVLLTPHDRLEVTDFQTQEIAIPKQKSDSNFPEVGELTLEEMEIRLIEQAMNYHNQKITNVAKSLGITRSALYRRLEKYGISYDTSS